MKIVLLAVLLAGVIAFGVLDLVISSGQPSTPAANAGAADTSTVPAQTLNVTPSGCYVPGDLIGEADPASIHCAAP